MTRPGDRLRALAGRILDPRTMERVVDPLVADLQKEFAEAITHGRVWKSRWVLIAGYIAFLKTIALCGVQGVMPAVRDWTDDDRSALGRVIGFSLAAIVLVTILIELTALRRAPFVPRDPRLLVYLIPQGLVLAVPIGVTFGIFLGFRGRVVSRRSSGAAVACAICCSLACLATLAWILPLANQAFRQLVFGQTGAIVLKGINELTIGELSQQIDTYRRTGVFTGLIDSPSVSVLSYTYHMRWALSCSTLVLSLFALSVTRRLVHGWAVAVAAFGACFSYYWLMWAGRAAALQETLPAFAGAWLPNMVFAAVSIAVVTFTTHRPGPAEDRPATS